MSDEQQCLTPSLTQMNFLSLTTCLFRRDRGRGDGEGCDRGRVATGDGEGRVEAGPS